MQSVSLLGLAIFVRVGAFITGCWRRMLLRRLLGRRSITSILGDGAIWLPLQIDGLLGGPVGLRLVALLDAHQRVASRSVIGPPLRLIWTIIILPIYLSSLHDI